jgi:hypothetical protein
MLEALRTQSDGTVLPPRYDAVLMKALLAHGANWGEAGERMRDLFKPDVGGYRIKDLIGRSLGYGLVDPECVLGCTEHRATLQGFGTLAKGEAHGFTLPLPAGLSDHSGFRRLTITLVFGQAGGAFVADVQVSIKDSGGAAILTAASEGPLFFAKLPAGSYSVEATYQGVAKKSSASVAATGQQVLDFRW